MLSHGKCTTMGTCAAHAETIQNHNNLLSIDPHMLTSLEGHVTIFSIKTTLKMAAECIIHFSDHARYELSMYVIYYWTLLRVEIQDPDA